MQAPNFYAVSTNAMFTKSGSVFVVLFYTSEMIHRKNAIVVQHNGRFADVESSTDRAERSVYTGCLRRSVFVYCKSNLRLTANVMKSTGTAAQGRPISKGQQHKKAASSPVTA